MVSKRRKLTAGLFLILFIAGATFATSSPPDVSIGKNGISINTGNLDLNGNDVTGISDVKDDSGDTVATVNDQQNSMEMDGGFKLPTGPDAYN